MSDSPDNPAAPQLPRFGVVARLRPVADVQPGTAVPAAPYAAASSSLTHGRAARVAMTSASLGLAATWDGEQVALELSTPGGIVRRASRRHGRGRAPTELALAVTGVQVSALVRECGTWVVRGVVDLEQEGITLPAEAFDVADAEHHGAFGQLGLRDLRLVTHADGEPYISDGAPALTATSAGPGGFRSAHTSVWRLDPGALTLTHLSDLYFRRTGSRGEAVYGDHATHLVRDGAGWLVASSTWGDFDKRTHPCVGITLSRSGADLLSGSHVLDSAPLHTPTDGFDSVGTWDPQLIRDGARWRVTYVSARRFFAFHPVVAEGPDLAHLRVRAAAVDRVATEGVTQVRHEGRPWILASDGRAGRRGQRCGYPVFDLDLHQVGHLQAAYPTNISWPTLVPGSDGLLLVGFDGTGSGGSLAGYGGHGAVVVQSTVSTS